MYLFTSPLSPHLYLSPLLFSNLTTSLYLNSSPFCQKNLFKRITFHQHPINFFKNLQFTIPIFPIFSFTHFFHLVCSKIRLDYILHFLFFRLYLFPSSFHKTTQQTTKPPTQSTSFQHHIHKKSSLCFPSIIFLFQQWHLSQEKLSSFFTPVSFVQFFFCNDIFSL